MPEALADATPDEAGASLRSPRHTMRMERPAAIGSVWRGSRPVRTAERVDTSVDSLFGD
jgi:hypothetical protein